jgi:hypothetical protein
MYILVLFIIAAVAHRLANYKADRKNSGTWHRFYVDEVVSRSSA